MLYTGAMSRFLLAATALWPALVVAAQAAPAPGFVPAPLPPEQALFSSLPPHDPRIAAGLSLAVNGAGQFYNHESAKGWWLLAPVVAYPAAWLLDAALGTGYVRFGDTLFIMGTKAYSVWDAYRTAEAAQPATEPGR